MEDDKLIIAVDRGNTRVKATFFTDGIATADAVETPDLEWLQRLTGGRVPDGAVYCSVGAEDDGLPELLRSWVNGPVIELGHDTPLPVRVQYRTPATLGPDRVAAVCGAAAIFPETGAVVADAGTALTVDVLSPGMSFVGGNISAGIGMRLKALHEHTARLPLVDPKGSLPVWGEDTETALRCGAVRGAVAEICAVQRDAEMMYGTGMPVVLTGGDAPLLAEAMPKSGAPIVVKDLVAVGLLHIYDYNENDL